MINNMDNHACEPAQGYRNHSCMRIMLHTFMHLINFLMAEVQLFTLGPWLYWFLINGASQPGGQDATALLPLFDMLNHDARQEVSLQTFLLF